MSILKDVMDTLKDIDTNVSADAFLKSKRYSSISARSNEGTLQFPVLVTRTMDIKTAQMVSKSLERKFASFVMITTTMSPTFVAGDKVDITDYLRRFHQNMNGKYKPQGFINDVISLAKENSTVHATDTVGAMFTLCEGSTPKTILSNKNQTTSIVDSLRTDILNEKFVPVKRYRSQYGVLEASGSKPRPKRNPKGGTIEHNELNITPNITPVITNQIDSAKRDRTTVSDKIMRDNDIKKANELVPTTLHLKVRPITPEGDSMEPIDFLIGVKSTMHGVDSEDMITNVVAACRNKNKLFKFIKWTSGEISFAKDLVFNINNIKEDIARRSSGSSPWWLALKRRRRLSDIKNKVLLPTGMLPNTTLVVTMEEVNLIKRDYGFDLLNPLFVDKIMHEYFLLSFVVVDIPGELAYFMFDGQKEYEIITFDGLERDNASNKGIDAKDVVKLMNRI